MLYVSVLGIHDAKSVRSYPLAMIMVGSMHLSSSTFVCYG